MLAMVPVTVMAAVLSPLTVRPDVVPSLAAPPVVAIVSVMVSLAPPATLRPVMASGESSAVARGVAALLSVMLVAASSSP